MRRQRTIGVLDVPAYTLAEAAEYLRVHRATLGAWVEGRGLIAPARATPTRLSFNNLVEAHVLSALRVEGVQLRKVVTALEYLRGNLGMPRPLLDARLETNGIDVFVEHLGSILQVSSVPGQVCIENVLRRYLKRIGRDLRGIPIKLFPFIKQDSDDTPVVIDPTLSFGRPVITGTGIRTAMVAERYAGGESVLELVEDYGLEEPQINAAICFESAKAA